MRKTIFWLFSELHAVTTEAIGFFTVKLFDSGNYAFMRGILGWI
jgi:hypothetical protein